MIIKETNQRFRVRKLFYAKLGYPSVKYFRWIFQSQQIIDCPVAVQDIKIAHAIWGKKIAAFKGKTTGKNPIHITGDVVIILKELIKIQKYVFLTGDILFLNGIPFFISLSCNFKFTTGIHIYGRKSITIFNDFKQLYMYYLKRGFRITTLHVDVEFSITSRIYTQDARGSNIQPIKC